LFAFLDFSSYIAVPDNIVVSVVQKATLAILNLTSSIYIKPQARSMINIRPDNACMGGSLAGAQRREAFHSMYLLYGAVIFFLLSKDTL
jgi:hypothetical protein